MYLMVGIVADLQPVTVVELLEGAAIVEMEMTVSIKLNGGRLSLVGGCG